MIRNEAAYRRRAEQDAEAELQSMTAEESIAIGEALLTSDLMRVAVFPAEDRPRASRSLWESIHNVPAVGAPMAPNEFDDFCRFAFSFLEDARTRFLVVGGLAVVVVGEPRTTADADAIVFVSQTEAESLIGQAAAAGFVRRHGDRLDVDYLERTLLPICELAEDMAPWNRLRRLLPPR